MVSDIIITDFPHAAKSFCVKWTGSAYGCTGESHSFFLITVCGYDNFDLREIDGQAGYTGGMVCFVIIAVQSWKMMRNSVTTAVRLCAIWV